MWAVMLVDFSKLSSFIRPATLVKEARQKIWENWQPCCTNLATLLPVHYSNSVHSIPGTEKIWVWQEKSCFLANHNPLYAENT